MVTTNFYPDKSRGFIEKAYVNYTDRVGNTSGQALKLFETPLTYAMETHTYTDYRLDHLQVVVYPASLDVQTETFSPEYDWSAFMSNLGGTMGLFTGFSLLSFMELVELMIDLCGQVVCVAFRRLCNASVSPSHSAP